MRNTLLLVALLLVGGCASDVSIPNNPPAGLPEPAAETYHRYDDPRLSPDERQAVRAAEATIQPQRPRPDVDQTMRFGVSRQDQGWIVTVYRVRGFKDGQPQISFGGHTMVSLDGEYRVRAVIPGR